MKTSRIATSSVRALQSWRAITGLPPGPPKSDLVAWDGDTLVFVEVKTRATAEFGPPDRAIADEKRVP